MDACTKAGKGGVPIGNYFERPSFGGQGEQGKRLGVFCKPLEHDCQQGGRTFKGMPRSNRLICGHKGPNDVLLRKIAEEKKGGGSYLRGLRTEGDTQPTEKRPRMSQRMGVTQQNRKEGGNKKQDLSYGCWLGALFAHPTAGHRKPRYKTLEETRRMRGLAGRSAVS